MEINVTKAGLLVAGEEVAVLGLSVPLEITRFAPSVEVAPVGAPLVLRVQDQTGASPANYIEATVAAGQLVATAGVGRVPIAAGATIFVRIVSAPVGANAASFLTGYFEASTRETGLTTFASLAQLKSFAGVTVSTFDADLLLILQAVTQSMQRYIGRTIVSTLYTAQRYRLALDTEKLFLRERPIVSVSAITEDGATVAPGEYVVEGADGYVFREAGWPRGAHLLVTYTAGYDPIPSDLADACVRQSAAAWRGHTAKAATIGLESEANAAGGSTVYVSDDWLPEVRRVLNAWRRL